LSFSDLANPMALALVAVLPLAAVVTARRAGERAIPMPGLDGIRVRAGRRAVLARFGTALRYLALALLIVGLARPRMGFQVTEETRKGVDIMLGLDVSYSMLARDYTPNRISGVRRLAAAFVDKVANDRVGVVAFAGVPVTQSPLTFDYAGLKKLIERVDVGMVGADGTAIGDALATCVYRLPKEQQERTRVIVFLTDGEQTAGYLPPIEGARVAATKGVRVYTIGVGSPEGVPIPMPPPYDDEIARDPQGRPVMTKLDETTLSEVARVTGGRYFRAETERELSEVLAQIALLEKTEVTVKKTQEFKERASLFLIPAAALLALDLLVFRGAWRVMH